MYDKYRPAAMVVLIQLLTALGHRRRSKFFLPYATCTGTATGKRRSHGRVSQRRHHCLAPEKAVDLSADFCQDGWTDLPFRSPSLPCCCSSQRARARVSF
ncbi:hypothetical protein BDA96_01G468100 [Sorghum bicolor]|uniref:Uncharacterized protein n=2 Tax=Sorghum bicolor TaxID=4558 RepID=A0A921S5F3_SORBI|nr:hypothetical protein BDA96_01G468100 [Sorghum bicolor]OQU92929.1 hypothetical protein SORBI_3001G439850 [Sorghum bicolor]